jgi:hypothetical protein
MDNKVNLNQEVVEIVNSKNNGSKWAPIVGSETKKLLESLNISKKSKRVLTEEAVRILGKCIPPKLTKGTNTGLVVGYIQSGKTMSFTAVATLARDNNFPMIIVIAGTSNPLYEQSGDRLRRDLKIDERRDRKWQIFKNPSIRESKAIEDTLMDWGDSTIPPDQRQTVLIVVMKNHIRLKNLANSLKSFRLNWLKIPTLIIDDEADQASLNTKINEKDESTTFKKVAEIRQIIPNHSFLQYTATPQGPLLINIINILSPFFAEVISPGEEYVGGKDFFIENPNLIELIHQSESLSEEDEPPESLKSAMRIFFAGAASGWILHGGEGNRSMMVHPSIRRMKHNQFYVWVTQIKDSWLAILKLADNDPDKIELIEDYRETYTNLSKTVKDLPKFEKIVEYLPTIIRKTIVEELNTRTGPTPIIDWKANYSYILVGGQAMDRGFTLEGLTVTYMPRGIGVGNADTVQQRARFFGYKRSYLGYCRIFIDQTMRDAYLNYVEHEEDIREHLIEHSKTGKPLTEWKRAFLMPRQLRPTRKNIIDIECAQNNFSETWFYPRSPHDSKNAIKENRKLIEKFIQTVKLLQNSGHKDRTEIMRHLTNENLLLINIYKNLLIPFRPSNPIDSMKYTGLILQIRNYLKQNPDESCSLYLMSCSSSSGGWLIRQRNLDENDQIENIFQGPHPDAKGKIYPGDRNVGDKSRLIIQLHKLNLVKAEKVAADNVYDIAVWIPKKFSKSWLVQSNNR